jgi:glutathione S-transferase
MRTLYHYQFSPFSRRTRLALAHKGLTAELREGRADADALAALRTTVPFRTIPVLVEEGRAMGDSTAIAHWLDAAYPDAPRLWPGGEDAAEVLQAATLVDVFLNNTIDVGTRYYPLRGDPAWDGVKTEMIGRALEALAALVKRASSLGRPTFAKSGWSAADMWLLTMVLWVESWPARAPTTKNIAQLTTLGIALPAELSRWADAHRAREDVRALGPTS